MCIVYLYFLAYYYLFLPSHFLIFDIRPAVMGIPLYRTHPYVDMQMQSSNLPQLTQVTLELFSFCESYLIRLKRIQ
mgnify:CR=1 FL=1